MAEPITARIHISESRVLFALVVARALSFAPRWVLSRFADDAVDCLVRWVARSVKVETVR